VTVLDCTPGMRHANFVTVRPGGVFISKTPCLKEMNPSLRIALPLMQLVGKAPYVAFLSAEDLEREMAAAGFEIIEIARHASRGKDVRPFVVARKAMATPA
jgi:hypothetical protein